MNPTSGPALEYAEYRPGGPLALRVRCVWALRAPADPDAGFEPVFPDGCMELVLNLADPFERSLGTTVERQDRAILVGQLLGPIRIRPSGVTDIVGVRFQPWGLRLAGPVEPMELVDRTILGEALAPGLAGSVAAALAEMRDLDQRCRFLTRVLGSGLLPPLPNPPPPALVALAGGRVRSVSSAAWTAGITPRQLERQSARWIGMPPSELVRLARFQRALHRLRRHPDLPLVRIALESGFSDQAHFTRDFGRFAGVSPSAFRAAISDLTATFISDPDRPAPAPGRAG
jgi:AraC-like DNA-binding protein